VEESWDRRFRAATEQVNQPSLKLCVDQPAYGVHEEV
jgi:hypothetical protein